MNYSKEIKSIFDRQNDNGGEFWSREDGDIHAPNGYCTIDTLNVLGELDATVKEYPILNQIIDFIFDYQTSDGCFKYSNTSSKLPCMSARILSTIGKLKVNDDKRTEKSYEQLLETQWSDGGWRCNTVKMGKSALTDASNPGTTLYVLDAFRFRNNNLKELTKLNKGIDFLLQHWKIRQPFGPCGHGIGSRFFQIEYPFLRYNLFYYVYVLSFYDFAIKDDRFQDAYKSLLVKIQDGNIIPENPHRSWQKFNFAKKGKISQLATKRWSEIEMNIKT